MIQKKRIVKTFYVFFFAPTERQGFILPPVVLG